MADSDAMAAKMIANLESKTGRKLEQWLALARRSKLAKHGELVKWLKAEHGMTHGYANLVAHKALGSDAGSASSSEALVDAQYAGKKAALRPIYDELVALAREFAPDVELAPKKAYVSLRRGKQFAIVQPSTATRVDLGLQLKGVPGAGRLEPSGSFSSMCSHRVRLESVADVDAEVRRWLQQACQGA